MSIKKNNNTTKTSVTVNKHETGNLNNNVWKHHNRYLKGATIKNKSNVRFLQMPLCFKVLSELSKI